MSKTEDRAARIAAEVYSWLEEGETYYGIEGKRFALAKKIRRAIRDAVRDAAWDVMLNATDESKHHWCEDKYGPRPRSKR